jgi:hypothetical protein
MADEKATGFYPGSVVDDATVPATVDDEPVEVAPDEPEAGSRDSLPKRAAAEPEDDTDEVLRVRAAATAAPSLRSLVERVPAAAAGLPSPPRSGSAFRVVDSLGASADALDVIENPAVRGSYLGVYHINLGSGRFALRLASSRDLRRWSKIADLDAGGGAMGALRALPGGGFLLAYEAQGPTQPNGKVATNVRLRFYRDVGALLSGRATEERSLPRRLSPTNEGTPNFRGVTWRGSLARSRVLLGFHWLDHGPKLPVDRQGLATLDAGKWSVSKDAGVDRALSTMGLHGNHGSRRQFHFPRAGKLWRIYEAQERVNVTGSWRVFLYDVQARRLQRLQIRTPGGSRSFANPTASILPSPAGGSALVVTMFIFASGAGSGEAGELVYYHDL